MIDSMDEISLVDLQNQDHHAWTEFMRQLRLIVCKACSGISDDFIIDEVVQEASIAFAIKIQSNSFELTSKLSTFMYSIARNQFLKLVKKKEIDVELQPDEIGAIEESQEELIEKEKLFELIENHLADLGEKCKEILTAYYHLRKRMTEIADELGYANAETVKNMKARCFKTLKQKCLG